jgi:hypothetical protein
VYNTKKNMPKRVGSQIFGNNRQHELLQGKSMNGRFQPINKKNIRNGSLRSSSVMGKDLTQSNELPEVSPVYNAEGARTGF